MGTIDLPLTAENAQARVELQRGSGGRSRRVLTGKLMGILRKGKGDTDVGVNLEYKIYPKKFRRDATEEGEQ